MKKLTLVLVDDDALLLRSLVRGFGAGGGGAGVEVLGAADAETAKSILQGRAVDVVITDFNMQGGTGAELLAWVRLQHPLVGRVLMTGPGGTATMTV